MREKAWYRITAFLVSLVLMAGVLPAATLGVRADGILDPDEFYVPDPVFREYLGGLNGANYGYGITFEAAKKLTGLHILDKGLSDLTGIEYCVNLKSLEIRRTNLTTLGLSSNTALTRVVCDNNPLTSVDVSKNPALEYLSLSNTRLASIDVSNNPLLTTIQCNDNALTALDVSHNPALDFLSIYENQVAALNVSNNPLLENLQVNDNQLTTLDVSNNPVLKLLNCSYNNMHSEADVIGLNRSVTTNFIFYPQNGSTYPTDPANPTDPTNPTNPTNPGSSTSSNSDSSSGGSSTPDSSRGTTTSSAPAPVSAAAATDLTQKAVAAAKANGSGAATVRLKNASDVSLNAMRAMVKEAGDMPVKLNADSMTDDGKAVDVRITVDPGKATKDVNLSASTISARAKNTETFFEKYYNNNVSVVSLAQQDGFGMSVEIAAKIDSGLNTQTLLFYSYDKVTNTYKQIVAPGYWIDKNGYLHFTTELAGEIIISDGVLERK